MSRSVKKSYFVDPVLYKRIERALAKKDRSYIKVWSRHSTVIPMMVGMNFRIHNGKNFIDVHIVENMVGCKLGEFALTRTFKQHAGDRKIKKG